MNLRSLTEKALLATGAVLVLLGLLLNQWVVGAVLAEDGTITATSTKATVWTAELLLILFGSGLIALRRRIGAALLQRGRLGLLAAAAVVGLAGGEVAVRTAGFEPWGAYGHGITIEPGDKLFTAHPTLGYGHLPGSYTVSLRDGYTFHVTHGADGLRRTRPPDARDPRPVERQVWVFGCSFTHGWTVDDEDSFPWRLQERLPEYDVVNFGVVGYGTLHSLIQFQEALAERGAPAAAVVAYASFHDRRNTFARRRRKVVASWNDLGPLKQPAARLRAGGLWHGLVDVRYWEVPLMRSSALAHLLEQTYNRAEERYLKGTQVTEAILREFAELAEERAVPLLVVGIDRDPATRAMLEGLARDGLRTGDIAVDLGLAENNNLPHDRHPSPNAHAQYAEKLRALLEPLLGG